MGRPAGTTSKTSASKTQSHVSSIAKQQFDVAQAVIKASKQLEELPSVVEQIKQQVAEIQASFAYELQEKEIEHDDKKKAKDAELVDYTASIEAKKAELDEEVSTKRLAQQRELEQLDYEHKVAIREKRYDTASRIASEQGKVLVDSAQFKELQMVKRANDEDLAEVAQTTELQVTERLTNKHTQEMKEMKASNELQVAMLRKDIDAANKAVESLKADKIVLEARIAEQTKTIAQIAENATRPSQTIIEGGKK